MSQVMGYLLLVIILFVIVSTIIFYLTNGIAPMPSSYKVGNILQAELPETIKGEIVEAGAGWGGISLWFAKQYPNNKVYAWENAWLPFMVLWIRAASSRKNNLYVKYGHFKKHSLENTGLIYTYLCRKGMRAVRQWMDGSPSYNLLLASNAFMLPEYQPDKTIRLGSGVSNNLYLYHLQGRE